MKMSVSVIVPVYNCAGYVERCVRSIMAQTHRDIEIICVDDGSTDESGKILDQLSMEDSRIRVIHQKNAGVSAARNAGIETARGDYITFVDSDDAIEPDMYETLLSFFQDDQVDIVHCGYKRIDLNGAVKDVNGTGRVVRQNAHEAAACLLRGTLFVGSLCNKLYKAHLFDGIRLDRSLAINEDVLMNAELFSRANDIVYCDTGKYLMYVREGSATSGTKWLKILGDCCAAAEKMAEVYRNTPVTQAAEERLLNCRIGLYRWYVMNGSFENRQARSALAHGIDGMIKDGTAISPRQKVNYRLMRYYPWLYRHAYKIYDRIRVPNWDVKPD